MEDTAAPALPPPFVRVAYTPKPWKPELEKPLTGVYLGNVIDLEHIRTSAGEVFTLSQDDARRAGWNGAVAQLFDFVLPGETVRVELVGTGWMNVELALSVVDPLEALRAKARDACLTLAGDADREASRLLSDYREPHPLVQTQRTTADTARKCAAAVMQVKP
jgi:hypothetical protein